MNKKIRTVLFAAFATCFLAESAWADECFKLSAPMEFGNEKTGEIEVKEICKSSLDHLMNLPIYGKNDRGDGIVIGEKKYKNCSDGFDASFYSHYTNTMQSIYESKCEILEKVKEGEIKIPNKTYLQGFRLSNQDLVTLDMFLPFSFVADWEFKEFELSKKSKNRLSYLIKKGLVKNYKIDKNILEFEFGDNWYRLEESLRADFNDDGIEDIFITINHGGFQAFLKRGSASMILTKTSNSSEIKQIKEENINDPCFDKNKTPREVSECLKKNPCYGDKMSSEETHECLKSEYKKTKRMIIE